MNKITIEISDIKKNFKETEALKGVSMRFETGKLYGIIGPAGAGKTTLFRLMLHLMKQDSGQITYRVNDEITPFKKIKDHLTYMPQTQSLYNDLSIKEHLDFFRNLYGIKKNVYKARKRELLSLTRLSSFTNRPAGKLSGGMYKKLGLMCALLCSPQVMFLDEPTNGVDPISRREFWEMLHNAVEKGILVIMTTAYMDEAERCGEVFLMENGCVLGHGEPRSLLAKENVANFDEYFLKRGGVK